MKLHVVSFQVPFPPDYGGLIDVYYKLKALKEAGCSVVLHTYRYEVAEQPDLLKVVDAVYYYERFTGWCSMFSFRLILFTVGEVSYYWNVCVRMIPQFCLKDCTPVISSQILY